MKKKWWIVVVLCILLAIALGIYFYYERSSDDTLTLYGNVDVRQVDIGFRVAGKVEELYFDEGDLVLKGYCIAKLDTTPYTSQVDESKAKLEAVQVSLKNAKILFDRRTKLIGSGAVSQEDLDDATTKYYGLVADLAAAEATVIVAEDNLRYTQAIAPNDGILLTRIREPGSVVNASEPVCTLSLVDPVWIRAYVNEPDLGRIYYGMEAQVFTDTKGGPVFKGKIGFISPVAEFTPKTVQTTQLRTDLVYRLRIYVDHSNKILKQGMPVTVKLDTGWMKSE